MNTIRETIIIQTRHIIIQKTRLSIQLNLPVN